MVSAEQARMRLVRGNEEYRASGTFHGRVDEGRRHELANGQHPLAVVVSCSDSRVLPEAIFSCGLGELFSIRVAGNVVGDHELGSIQYAYEHLGCRLVVVLGHSCCGAVHAAFGEEASGYVGALIRPIRDAAHSCSDERAAAMTNACVGAECVRTAIPDNGLIVLPAFYDIESGEVAWL